MPVKPKPKTSWLTLLILAAAMALWWLDHIPPRVGTPHPPAAQTIPTRQKPPEKSNTPHPTAAAPSQEGNYEVYHGCQLVENHSNDGDSFLVRLPGGRQEILRLYYVDTPESQFRRYKDGQTNHERIRQQAAEMGGITPEQAVEIGKQAKMFTLTLLETSPFTIYTCWDSPFHDQRYHAFVEVIVEGKPRWLHELLIEKGIARIKTKPAPLPDGTTISIHQTHLRQLQSTARAQARGVWKF